MTTEYVNFWNDRRFCRERDTGNHLLTHGANAAQASVLADDAPAAARELTCQALDLARNWVGDERFAGTRLVFSADPGELAGAVTSQ